MHLAPPGSNVCDFGQSVSKPECEAAAKFFNPNPGRSLKVCAKLGTCLDGSCGQVPFVCSIQTGGDGTAHYKTKGDTGKGCIHQIYQLICTDRGMFYYIQIPYKTTCGYSFL